MKPSRKNQAMAHLARAVFAAVDWPSSTRLLVGVSGGSDSVALLHLLVVVAPRRGWTLGVAHLHHGLRGAAADEDAAFVRRLSCQCGLRCHVQRVDVPALAQAQRLSFEMAARTTRQRFFRECVGRYGYDGVALGHTRDDQAETVLLRLLRGSGLTGLAAIRPAGVQDGLRIVRPLLGVTKEQLRQALQQQGHPWREDATNQDTAYGRNRVRHELLPFLRDRFNPRIEDALVRTADLLQADDAVLHTLLATDWAACRVPDHAAALAVVPVAALPLARRRRLLWHWCAARAPAAAATLDYAAIERVEQLLASRRGQARVPVGADWVVRTYDRLEWHGAGPATPTPSRLKLKRPGVTVAAEWGVQATLKKIRGFKRTPRRRWGEGSVETYLAVAALGRAHLYLRRWQPGDRLQPPGMRGSRKLQDIFTDLKIPREQRSRIPLLECRGRVIWVPGYAPDRTVTAQQADDLAWHITLRPLRQGS